MTEDNPELQKAVDFLDAAEDAGWDVEWQEIEDDVDQAIATYVKATRDPETIDIQWTGKRLAHILYTHDGGEYRNLPNVAEARRRLNGDPLPPPRRGRPQRPEDAEDTKLGDVKILPRIWPFDLNEADDEEIIDAVRGRQLIWWNRWRLQYEVAHVLPLRQKHIRVEEHASGKLILHFVSPEGFRAVAINTLAQVR